uniref:ZP domain-containing protein n=1 Tax=Ascaris lumbricoides TaxID=6252 RepID=A0A0M3I8A8_ASCLU
MFFTPIFFQTLIVPAAMLMIDNELVGTPTVDCEDTMLSLTFKTRKPFTGRVYVRGLADDDRCSRNFATNIDQDKFSLMVQNGDCTMQRQRVTGSLEGIMFSLTIVVSFHGTFVTKVDRAFRCMCFFRNIKRLTSGIDMSPIGTTELLDTAKMPTCSYSIHAGTPNGPPVVYGQVGDKIYHVWECDDDSQGFLVHSCFVNDGRGARFDLLDIDGCAIDPIIQPDVKYDAGIRKAVAETWGYKFSDTSVLNYQCVVELCKKSSGECEGLTPPSCGRSKREANNVTRRQIRETRLPSQSEMDLIASVNMLDSLDEDGISDPRTEKLFNRINEPHYHPRSGIAIMTVNRVCLSYPTLGALLATTTFLLTIAATATTLLLGRSR